MGPNDCLLTSTLTMARVLIFDKSWSWTNVCAWDVAAAHLMHEDALRRNPEESAGQAFLISGKGLAWRLRDIRNAVKVNVFCATQLFGFGTDIWHSTTNLVLSFSTKYHLYWLSIGVHSRASCGVLVVHPLLCMHCYHCTCSVGQNLTYLFKYTVDEMQSGRARDGHGLQLKSDRICHSLCNL